MYKHDFALLMLFSLLSVIEAANLQTDTSCADVYRLYPAKVESLFAQLNLDYAGLENVKTAVTDENWVAACSLIIAYYRYGTTASWLRIPPVTPGTGRDSAGDTLVNSVFWDNGARFQLPRRSDGWLDWTYGDPGMINRHQHIGSLLSAYQKTGNPIYAQCFDEQIRGWVICYPYMNGAPNYDGAGAIWGILTVGVRLRESWEIGFYGFQSSDAFTSATRILMLSSIFEQADDLYRNNVLNIPNWAMIEMHALGNIGACFPEANSATNWLNFAANQINGQWGNVLPDGISIEISSSYHNASLGSFDGFADVCRHANYALPAGYTDKVEKMWDFLAYELTPDGFGVQNGDNGCKAFGGSLTDPVPWTRQMILDAAAKYERKDWLYIATNGDSGTRPADPPSRVWPYGGIAIMRSGWDKEAQWSFFDVGPWGYNHTHNDKLQFSTHAFGRDLLVDGGCFDYGSEWYYDYYTKQAAHNIIVMDSFELTTGDGAMTYPMTGNYVMDTAFDYVRGTAKYDNTNAEVTRSIVYLRNQMWLVFDHVETSKPKTIHAQWHFNPDCNVQVNGLEVASNDADTGNLKIAPLGSVAWKLDMVKGQTSPKQGWYSPTFNQKYPNSTAIYSANISKSTTFAWVMTPAKGVVPVLATAVLDAPDGAIRVRVTQPDGKSVEVAVRLAGTALVPLSRGRALNGECAILRDGDSIRVVNGTILQRFQLSADTLQFNMEAGGANPEAQNITISYDGTVNPNSPFTVVSDSSWLATAPVSGSGNGQVFSNTVNLTGRPSGVYQTTVRVSRSDFGTVEKCVVIVRVNGTPVPVKVVIAPDTGFVLKNGSKPFAGTITDQFNAPFVAKSIWSVSGGGTIDSTGLFVSSGIGGTYVVTDSLRDYPNVKSTAIVIVDTTLFKFSRDFTTVQGLNNVYYQYWDGATYKDMSWVDASNWWNGNEQWLIVQKGSFNPGNNSDAVLKWVAPIGCKIRITGNVKMNVNNGDGDGIAASIKHNADLVWGPDSIGGYDYVGVNHDLTLDVLAGDAIYFIVNCKINNRYDGALWDPVINQVGLATGVEVGKNPAVMPLPLSAAPNPFNPQVFLKFAFVKKANVVLRVYDARGGLVNTLVQGELAAGPHSIVWNGRNNIGKAVSSGIYVVKLSGNGREEAARVLFLK